MWAAHRKPNSECRGLCSRRHTGRTATGEGRPDSAVLRPQGTHYVRHRDLGVFAVPAERGRDRRGKAQPKPRMHDAKKSDPGVPRGPCVNALGKVANKGAQAPAESLREESGRPQRHTQWWGPVTQGAERIRQFVKREPKEKLTAVLHHITTDTCGRPTTGCSPERQRASE